MALSSSSCHVASTYFSDSLSLATCHHRPSLPAGLPGYNLYLHRAAVDSFLLVSQPLIVHVRGSKSVHLLMSSPLLHQQCTACLVRLILMVLMMGVRWHYSCCFVVCCPPPVLFNTARSILV